QTCALPISAALLLSQTPSLSPDQVRGILVSTTDDLGQPGWDHFTGAGRLNIERALKFPFGSHVQILNPVNDGGTALNNLPIIGTALHPMFRSWALYWQPGITGGNT